MTYPRIIAHRCGGALAPENTLAGLRIAARLGCQGVEFDTMLSADGVPVLIHDETLERTTSGRGRVAELACSQIIQLDAGGWHHPAFTAEPVPTLDQVLQLCAALGLWANVEIKPSSGLETETGQVVARHAAAAKCRLVLSSFSPEALQAAAAEAPTLPRALLVGAIPADWRKHMDGLGAIALHSAARKLTADMANAVLADGFVLACYTVNQRDAAERLFAMGVSAMFTDRPDLWSAAEM